MQRQFSITGLLTLGMAMLLTGCNETKDMEQQVNELYEKMPQQERIAQTAQAILDARALYPDSSLADLYDPITMPPELLKAHRDNDRAVMAAYGFPTTLPETEIVAKLFTLYNNLTQQ